MKRINDFDVKNKRVLVRCDFQVPVDKNGNILSDFKIVSVIPTIEYLIKKEAKVILMSHWKPAEQEKAYSLKPISAILERLLKKKVKFLNDCIGGEVIEEIKGMKSGEIVLLENLRFHKEEEENDESFAKELAQLGDIYINDAFSVSHRKHASIVGIPRFIPSGAGFLLEKEVNILNRFFKNPQKPVISIIGGGKVETKSKLIDAISEISEYVLIGGLIERELQKSDIILKHPEKIISPVDDIDTFDIGPATIKIFKEKISKAKTIFWNGPFGKIEEEKYQNGTKEIIKAIIESGAFSIVGGGETIEFINHIGLDNKFSYISTGGGAMLDFICDGTLVGIDVLK